MLASFASRTAQALVTLFGGSVAIWLLLNVAPGDPAMHVLAARGRTDPDPALIEATRAELGVDEPLPARFARWLLGAVRGDLGVSWRTGRPVAEEFAARLPSTLLLTGVALVFAIGIALVLGLVAAAAPRRWPDAMSRTVALAMVAVPGFLVGVLLLDVVVVQLGMGRVISDGTLATVGLPAFTLALISAGSWSRVLRASVLEARAAPHLDVSAARGAGPLRQLLVHLLPNSLPPFLTVVGVSAAYFLGGTPIVEAVFTWPGLGSYVIESIHARDMPAVAGFALLAVAAFVLVSLVVDLLLRALDPRLRGTGRRR
ncbi:ABC transporter permease [Amycolatopsis cihanbeyliensis]|uniref:Peptide/nickel transport system permease protein n=1 Tax=Amycolatopsis cihanbeyliensis TaxID=1128664 RepID=A0A542DRI1_AMYCI|nr:ABC transporter permease [Amycolatopsis cihanbeyliensis]TQJ05594.1 peptide/nickel transport system permease protein [Amycolatopsis cihanbeyliensis]